MFTDGSRFFAYATWVLMVTLAIILTANRFLSFVTDPGWVGLATLLIFGLVYMNFTYAAIRRFIMKVPEPTNEHFMLTAIIFILPAIWINFISEHTAGAEFILTAILLLACVLGNHYGNRAGIRKRYEYIQKLKERQRKQAESKEESSQAG